MCIRRFRPANNFHLASLLCVLNSKKSFENFNKNSVENLKQSKTSEHICFEVFDFVYSGMKGASLPVSHPFVLSSRWESVNMSSPFILTILISGSLYILFILTPSLRKFCFTRCRVSVYTLCKLFKIIINRAAFSENGIKVCISVICYLGCSDCQCEGFCKVACF